MAIAGSNRYYSGTIPKIPSAVRPSGNQAPVSQTSPFAPSAPTLMAGRYNDPDTARSGAGTVAGPHGTNPDAVAQWGANDAMRRYFEQQANEQYRSYELGGLDAYRNWATGNNDLDYYNQKYALDKESLAAMVNDANLSGPLRDQIIANLNSLYGLGDEELANQNARSWLNQQVEGAVNVENQNQARLATTQELQTGRSRAVSGGSFFFPGYKAGQNQTQAAGDMALNILNQRLRGINEGGELERGGYDIANRTGDVGIGNSILNQRIAQLGDQSNARQAGLKGRELDIGYRRNVNNQTLQNDAAAAQINQLRGSGNPELMALGERLAKQMGLA